jgi:pimeloyl-ACP methyl ester carboxylesterase
MANGTKAGTRRDLLGGAAVAAGAAVFSAGSTVPAFAQTPPKAFLLVHGAWHGGWCWRRVSDALEKRGHKVFSPTLTGLGERSHLLDGKINLSTHVTDIANVIKWEGFKDFVLVGHSYGGFVISALAEQLREPIASIVFLDAFLPDDGQSLSDIASQPVREGIAAALQRGEIGLKPVPASVFRVNEKDRAWVDAMCTPHPIGTFTEKVKIDGARDRVAKRAYIRAKEYPSPSFDAARARAEASGGWRVYDMACGHDAMVDMPERLTEILLEVA